MNGLNVGLELTSLFFFQISIPTVGLFPLIFIIVPPAAWPGGLVLVSRWCRQQVQVFRIYNVLKIVEFMFPLSFYDFFSVLRLPSMVTALGVAQAEIPHILKESARRYRWSSRTRPPSLCALAIMADPFCQLGVPTWVRG